MVCNDLCKEVLNGGGGLIHFLSTMKQPLRHSMRGHFCDHQFRVAEAHPVGADCQTVSLKGGATTTRLGQVQLQITAIWPCTIGSLDIAPGPIPERQWQLFAAHHAPTGHCFPCQTLVSILGFAKECTHWARRQKGGEMQIGLRVAQLFIRNGLHAS